MWELWAHASDDAVPALADAPAPRGRLYFFSRGTTLVLSAYPDDWPDLSWAELDALRGRAQVLGHDAGVHVLAGPAERVESISIGAGADSIPSRDSFAAR